MEEYNNTLYDFLIQKCQKHANICYYQEKKKRKDNSSFVQGNSKINFREIIFCILLNLINFFHKIIVKF